MFFSVILLGEDERYFLVLSPNQAEADCYKKL